MTTVRSRLWSFYWFGWTIYYTKLVLNRFIVSKALIIRFKLHMSKSHSSKTITDRVCTFMGMIIPSCMEGLRLVELGKQRPLKLHERMILFYNSPLCLHCNCNREKFDKERAKLRVIEQERRQKK